MPLYSTNDERGNSMTSLIKGENLKEASLVSVLVMDSLLESKSVDLITIDVEGFENEVLLGARNVLRRDRPVLLTEALSDANLESQSSILLEENYNPPIRTGHTRGDDRNYIWIPKEKRKLYLIMMSEINLLKLVNFWRKYV